MYLEYWKLRDFPFENVPDPAYFYDSARHHKALEELAVNIERRKGAVMLTGEIGSGKTTVTQRALLELPENRFDIALINYPSLTPLEMLREVNRQLGLETSGENRNHLLQILQEHLIANARAGRDTLICIDEAQSIPSIDTLEELRLLLNFQLSSRFLLTLILVGQPELQEKIRQLPQLRQRIALHMHLGALSLPETARYMMHRLRAAGSAGDILTRQAVDHIYKHTGGIPRCINHLADRCLMSGMQRGANILDSQLVLDTLKEYPMEPLDFQYA